MELDTLKIVQVLKRLRAAVGYYELGMKKHALRCLDTIPNLGNTGIFGLVADVLRDEFAKDQEVSPAKALVTVACMLPAPARGIVELTLAACYGSRNGRGGADERQSVTEDRNRQGIQGGVH